VRGLRRSVFVAAFPGALLLAPAVPAAAFTVRSEVDARKVGIQDQVQLTITIEGADAPDGVDLPPLVNLDVVGGPMQSSQYSIVNGRMSQSRSYTYVLQPRAAGKAEVGAVRVGDQVAPAIPIEVVAGSIRPPARPRPGPFGTDPFGDPFEEFFGRRRPRGPAGKVLMEATASRTRLRVGEPLVVTYWIVTNVQPTDLQPKQAPQFPGFWAEDLERPPADGEPVTIEGERYVRLPMVRKLLFPTKAGTLTIPASTFRIGIAGTGFFDAGGVVERATKPLTVAVDPLPNAPGFTGAVGRFRTSATLDRASVPLGEAAMLRFRVEGTGNLKWIDRAPEVVARGAKVFPPQAKSDLRATTDGIAGSRTWEFVVVPETSGVVEVPALPFSWFDPSAGRVVTAQTKPLTLKVEGGTGALPVPAAAGGGARALGGLPLRADLDRRPVSALALTGPALAMGAVAVLLLHAGLWGVGRLRPGSRGRGRAASPRSVRVALRELERAGREPMSKEQAASLVEKALHEAFGDIPEDEDGDAARTVRALLDDVRFVRYAPQLGEYGDKVHDLAERSADAVRRWA
jgi:hypothetical protein